MVGDRAVMRMRQVPADKPVFQVLSIYNLHGPNTPTPHRRGIRQCDSMPPWLTAAFNEADVSDKPAVVAICHCSRTRTER